MVKLIISLYKMIFSNLSMIINYYLFFILLIRVKYNNDYIDIILIN